MSTDLLRMLGASAMSASRPAIDAAQARWTGANISGASFAELLARADGGRVESGLPVKVAGGVELSETQLSRMASALDLAEASGAARAIVLMDGKAFKVDVSARTVLSSVELTPGSAMSGVDAVVRAPEPPTQIHAAINPLSALRRVL